MIIKIPNAPIVKVKCPVCNGTGEKERAPNEVIIISCSNCQGSGISEKIRDMSSTDDNVLFYIDQNIISEMREGTYKIPKHRIFDLSQQRKHRENDFVVYIYSNETLAEISRTAQPKKYLDVLASLKALKLLEYIDIQNPKLIDKPAIHTGKLQPLFKYIDPEIFFQFYNEATNSKEEYLSDIILFANTVLHVASLLDIEPTHFDLVNLDKKEKLKELTQIINKIRETLGTTNSEALKQLKQANPIEDIWKRVIKPKLKNPDITENIFFSFLRTGNVSSNIINAHIILNIIGYYPDSNNKVISNISGFISDVKHVNIALRTDVFLTYDNNLAHRAAALYKWENSKTGYNLMTVFKRFGKKDTLDYIETETETADQASDRSICLYARGELTYNQ